MSDSGSLNISNIILSITAIDNVMISIMPTLNKVVNLLSLLGKNYLKNETKEKKTENKQSDDNAHNSLSFSILPSLSDGSPPKLGTPRK